MNALRSILILLALGTSAIAAAQNPTPADQPQEPPLPLRPVKGYYYTEMDGDSVRVIVLNDVYCYPPMVFKNKKAEEFYWRTVRDVKKTLPYAKLICETLLETYEYIETLPTQKEREDYLKRMESAVFEQYKPTLKRFTKSQAQMLCKLIRRETNQSGYSIIKAFLGSFRAGFWQTFGRFFGVNLKVDYRPDKDKNDGIVERVACYVEMGLL